MRRIPALLIAATLAAAPASAAASPSHDPGATSSTIQQFEWSTSKGRLGVSVMTLTPELRKVFGAPPDRGVLVSHVEPGTPAAAAGLAVGDVITQVRGRAIDRPYDVLAAIDALDEGERVPIELVRDGKARSVAAILADDAPSLGREWSLSPWLRDWMMPFGSDRALAPVDERDWFRDWSEPFEPRPRAMPAWLCKLRELTFPSRPDLVCRRA